MIRHTSIPLLSITLAIVFTTLLSLAENTIAKNSPRLENFEVLDGPSMSNFDWLEGVWNVESHSLKQRMTDEEEWLENHMETKYRVLLGGLVVINDTYGKFNGRAMHGVMIRTYDPVQDDWRFQWMSRGYPHLTEQVRGNFKGGIGTFFGTEIYQGKTYKLRFRWKMLSQNHAFWEQAYQHPESLEWQVNWTLDLTRKQSEENP